MTTPKLSIRGVAKAFEGHEVLRGVDLDIATHQVVCLIGSSGSGKSTLLKCINLLVPVDTGDIVLDGVAITDSGTNPNTVRQSIGIVFQAFNLFPHMTVIDNITLGPRKVHRVGRPEAEDQARVLLDQFGLLDKAKEYPDRLSGGQQQRVAIVRALVSRPSLMLLDEVTSALDPELVGEVLGVIRLLKADGMTMVIATHEMGFARDVADVVAFLDGGVILEQGRPSEVFGNPHQPRTRQFLQRIVDAGRL